MIRRSATSVLVAFLAFPLVVGAQTTAPSEGTGPLQLRRDAAPPRPIVRPDTLREQAVRDAERAAQEYERAQRGESLIREQSRPPRRPDLGYDVYGGIQQRNIPRR